MSRHNWNFNHLMLYTENKTKAQKLGNAELCLLCLHTRWDFELLSCSSFIVKPQKVSAYLKNLIHIQRCLSV